MQYIMKSGTLYQEDVPAVLAKMKSAMIGSQKKIYNNADELLLEARIRETKAHTADVRNREYILTDRTGKVAASAFPGYADGEAPEVAGWPVCRMPKVDRANITLNGAEYVLRMQNNRNYTMTINDHGEVLRITHRGSAGGWMLEDSCGFAPEILCGLFAFCRYIEQENEFLIV